MMDDAPDDPTGPGDAAAALAKLRAGSSAPPQDAATALARLRAGPPGHDYHAEYASGALGKRMASENAADAANTLTPGQSLAERVGGGLANSISEVPGGQALTAGAHALLKGEPYGESLKDVQSAEAMTPAVARIPLKIAGGVASQIVMPGSGAVQGAQYGFTRALGNAGPMSLADRLKTGVKDAAIDGAVGAAAEGLTTGIRAKFFSKAPDANVVARDNAMHDADFTNYGKADAEGAASAAAGPTHPDLTAALDESDIKPYADIVRGARQFRGANDVAVAAETFAQMSKQQGGLAHRMAMNGYDAATQIEYENLGLAKAQLRAAIEKMAPSFGSAVDAHAGAEGATEAVERGRDMAGMAMNGTQPVGSKLGIKSVASYLNDVPQMARANATAGSEGILGQAGQSIGTKMTPTSLFGAVPSLRALKVAPLVSALDEQAGNQVPAYLRRGAVSLADQLRSSP